MKNTAKKDPRDYTLRELPELCKSIKDCDQCPIHQLDGLCRDHLIPMFWDLGDAESEITPDAVAQALLDAALTAGGALNSLFDKTRKVLETLAAALQALPRVPENESADDVRTETIELVGGQTLIVKTKGDYLNA